MPAFRMNVVGKCKAAAEFCDAATMGYLQQLQRGWRELRERLWFRNVFTAELGEAVICTDEEIEAADVMSLIIRRTV